ncbi:MAG TPA: Nramp family divalent metal transporter [Candidatus Polarisedimenticolaceae bacterium]|nr:Nramp family divalent metal transporter [Candidatus Polarisedimenticolaceae bacterium]
MSGEPSPDRVAPEAKTGLDPWVEGELPPPPEPTGLAWLGVVGPGVIVLGASIGSGEFLLGPAAFVKYGLSLLWVTGLAAFLQTVFNTELMRYTLATGEPIFSGFMRTRPGARFWGFVYSLLYVLQVGWPGWAGAAAGAVFFLFAGRVAATGDEHAVYLIGVGTFAACVAILAVGRRIERTLEILNWILVAMILGGFVGLAVALVAPQTWLAAIAGFIGFAPATGRFQLIPADADFFLIGAFAAYSGAGGMINLTLSNWARDKGYGMAAGAGYIPAATAGRHVHLTHTGFRFEPDAAALERWRGWWRVVRADQWGVYFIGAIVGMALPGMIYVTFLPAGSDIRGLGIAAALADALRERAAPWIGIFVALLGVWVLFKTQLDILDGVTRALTDILWTGSRRLRRNPNADVRAVYYGVLLALSLWGVVALRLTQPIVLLQIGANMAGIVFIVTSIHLLRVNTTLLPPELRPPTWRRLVLIGVAVFYGSFVSLWLASLVGRSGTALG